MLRRPDGWPSRRRDTRPPSLGDGIPVPGCVIPVVAATINDIRFVTHWGLDGADPGLGGVDSSFIPSTDRCIVYLSSSSGDVNLVVSGGTGHLLHAWDSPTPANFGGDGHAWWRVYYVVPESDTLDFTGTTGPFRQLQSVRFQAQLTDGSGPFGQSNGAFGSGIEISSAQQLAYSGSHSFHAEETVGVDQSTREGEFVSLYIDSWYRSIDDITIDKFFHAGPFNHDAHFFNAQPIPLSPGGGVLSSIDWWFADRVTSVTMGQEVQADFVVAFENSVRCLSTAVSVKLRALCAVHLIA